MYFFVALSKRTYSGRCGAPSRPRRLYTQEDRLNERISVTIPNPGIDLTQADLFD
jgi:hypothetical protein